MIKPKVVILGGGFGGLAAARALYKTAEVTVVDRHNYQTFLPLLYQVSTAGLAAAVVSAVSYGIRWYRIVFIFIILRRDRMKTKQATNL